MSAWVNRHIPILSICFGPSMECGPTSFFSKTKGSSTSPGRFRQVNLALRLWVGVAPVFSQIGTRAYNSWFMVILQSFLRIGVRMITKARWTLIRAELLMRLLSFISMNCWLAVMAWSLIGWYTLIISRTCHTIATKVAPSNKMVTFSRSDFPLSSRFSSSRLASPSAAMASIRAAKSADEGFGLFCCAMRFLASLASLRRRISGCRDCQIPEAIIAAGMVNTNHAGSKFGKSYPSRSMAASVAKKNAAAIVPRLKGPPTQPSQSPAPSARPGRTSPRTSPRQLGSNGPLRLVLKAMLAQPLGKLRIDHVGPL